MKKATKVWLIIATVLFLIGTMIIVGDLVMVKFDFSKIGTTKYETNTYDIQEDYKNIKIVTNTANVTLVPSEDGKDMVVCEEEKSMKHLVEVKDDTLFIQMEDTRKWYEHIGVNFGISKITVYLSKEIYDTLSIKTSTGKVSVENVSADSLDITVSTGKVQVTDVTCKGDIKIEASTGKVIITNSKSKNVISKGSTGDLTLKNVLATEKFSIQRSTGNVKLEKSDALEIYIKTSTGNVTGTLLSEKIFITKTNTGDIKVPESVTGGRCEIKTNTGDIKLTCN